MHSHTNENEQGWIYLDHTNTPIDDPAYTIKLLNRPKVLANDALKQLIRSKREGQRIDINAYRHLKHVIETPPEKKFDYHAFHPRLSVAITELWGDRNTQEDRAIAGELKLADVLQRHHVINGLQQAARFLQSVVMKHPYSQYQGSTACSTFVTSDELITMSIGDSVSLLIEQHHKKIKIKPLSSLKKSRPSRRLLDKRTGYSLGLDNALGDVAFEEFGLTHMPTITFEKLNRKQGVRYFVVTACDGLTDANWDDFIPDLTNVLENHIKQSHSEITAFEITKVLANSAYDEGSHDNISVIAVEVTQARPELLHLTILDGHGGDDVSHVLSVIYDAILQFSLIVEYVHDIHPSLTDVMKQMVSFISTENDIERLTFVLSEYNSLMLAHVIPSLKNSQPVNGERLSDHALGFANQFYDVLHSFLLSMNATLSEQTGLLKALFTNVVTNYVSDLYRRSLMDLATSPSIDSILKDLKGMEERVSTITRVSRSIKSLINAYDKRYSEGGHSESTEWFMVYYKQLMQKYSVQSTGEFLQSVSALRDVLIPKANLMSGIFVPAPAQADSQIEQRNCSLKSSR